MFISKKQRLTASVMTAVFACSFFAGGCSKPTQERASESAGALAHCDPFETFDDEEEDEDDDIDIPEPMTDAQLAEAERNRPREVAPPPRPVERPPVLPVTPMPVAPSAPDGGAPVTPAPTTPSSPDGGVSPKASMACQCRPRPADSPRRAALKAAARRRREEYDDLYTKLGFGAVVATAAGYAALQVKNGKPPTHREVAALGITITAGVYATYYSGVLDIERRYKRAYEAAMELSDQAPQQNCADFELDRAYADHALAE